jgi:hypothetical protein
MPTIIAGFKWDDSAHHDSELSLAEMIGLVNRVCDDVPEMKNPPATMPLPIKRLSDVLQGKISSDPAIHIIKGIHQANELHFTLKVSFAHQGPFHIYLAKGDAVTVYSKAKRDDPQARKHGVAGKVMPHTLYLYKPVGVTYEEPKDTFVNWPAAFAKNSYPGRVRSNSLSATTRDKIGSTPPNPVETRSGKLVNPPKKS